MSLYSKCISCGQHIVGPYFLSFLMMCLLTGGVETICVTVAEGDFSLTPHHLSFVPCVHFSSATFRINGTHVMIPPHLLCSLTSHHSGSFHPGGSFRACAGTPDQTQSMGCGLASRQAQDDPAAQCLPLSASALLLPHVYVIDPTVLCF